MSERFLNAYYYSFDATGCDPVDAILEAVAQAGKGCHNTEDWGDFGYPEKIQAAAAEAADRLERTEARVADLEGALDELKRLCQQQYMELKSSPSTYWNGWAEAHNGVSEQIDKIVPTLANTTPAKPETHGGE